MRRLLSAPVALLAVFMMLAIPLTGCVEDDVGVRCEGPIPDDEGSTAFDLQSMQCESRICIHYLSESAGARCTIPCEDNGDCPDEGISGCQTGFVCRIGTPLLSSGVSCCKFCVCKDDAQDTDPLATACAGKSAQCPDI